MSDVKEVELKVEFFKNEVRTLKIPNLCIYGGRRREFQLLRREKFEFLMEGLTGFKKK